MIFCFPYSRSCDKGIGQLTDCGRLYAYPNPPTKSRCSRIILDSGAYSLGKRRKIMDEQYMCDLSQHYFKYADERTICVAPDVVLNPFETMKNYKKWINSGKYPDIAPVMQLLEKGRIEKTALKYQIDYYVSFKVKTILFALCQRSNIAIYSGIREVTEYARAKGIEYVHMLGAGWDMDDVKCWAESGLVDSIDCTSYYNSGRKQKFGSDDPVENAKRIIECIRKYEQNE